MKRRYFLRGLGAGIVLSAVVMSVTSTKADLTDSEIRKRALELGMVEKPDALEQLLKETKIPATTGSAVTADKENNLETAEPTDFPTIKPIITKKPTNIPNYVAPKETSNPEPKATKSTTVGQTTKTTSKPATKTSAPQREIVSVNIIAGMWSDEIAQKFKELGLIENAKAFDKFLCDNDYASLIRVGSYKIPKGSSYEEIAKIITK